MMDPKCMTFQTLDFSNQEELLARLDSCQCTTAASVLRMFVACGQFVEEDESNDWMAPFLAPLS